MRQNNVEQASRFLAESARQMEDGYRIAELEKERDELKARLSKFDDIKSRVNNLGPEELFKLLDHYVEWKGKLFERSEREPTEASCDFSRLKSSMAQLITRDEYFGDYGKEQGE